MNRIPLRAVIAVARLGPFLVRVHFTFLAAARKPRPRGRCLACSARADAGMEQIDH